MPATAWPTDDLVRRVERALDMAAAAIALVAAVDPGVDLDALEAPPDKVIAETAMFLRAAAAIPAAIAPGCPERAHELARALRDHARSPRVAVGIALHPALARDYGAAHLVLTAMGHPDPGFDRGLAAALASPAAGARERLPHRELEQAWLASLAGDPPPSPALVARTALGRGTDLLTGSRDDVYALTHALLYATDFGGRALPRTERRENVLATAQSALAGACDDDDFDLAGELLLAWPFHGATWTWVPSFAFAVLARVEDEAGVLPSLALTRADYDRHPAAARGHYVAAAAYHTAYVMGLLCATLLRRGSRPLVAPPTTPGARAFTEQLLRRLAADGRAPQWWRDARAQSLEEQVACTPFLLDVALLRAVRRLDLAAVRALLDGIVTHQIAPSPLCLQAAGLLRRLAGCATVGGGVVGPDQSGRAPAPTGAGVTAGGD